MYQIQITDLKNSIINYDDFEGVQITNPNFKGIKILGVRKIPSSINQGKHGIYVDLENYRGQENKIKFNNSVFIAFDKPNDEVATNAPIYGSNNKIQIVGRDSYSQIIEGFDASHTDAGHSSYYVYAEFVNEVTLPDPPTEPDKPVIYQSELKSIIEELEKIIYRLDELVEKL